MPLFINPAVHPKSQWSFITRRMALQPPIGIGFLAGYLRAKTTARISILDEAVSPITEEDLRRELAGLDSPRMVCISSMTIQIGRAFELAAQIKALDPECKIILGGIHPTVMPEDGLRRGCVDIVVRYEGEETLVELYEKMKNGDDWSETKGISFVDAAGEIRHNPARRLTPLDADYPQFPFDLFEKNLASYNAFGSISSSRGCPHNCIFCSNRTITGNTFRHFPIGWIEKCIDDLINVYGQTYIMFLDDVIFINRKHFKSIVDMILRRGFHKKACFHGGARADTITPEIVELCRSANFVFFGVGVETGSDSLLKVLNKRESAAQIKNAIDLITGQGMMTSGAFIFGIPGETHKDRKNSLRYALSLPIDNARFNNIVPYPGTKMYEIAKKDGGMRVMDDYYNFNVQFYLFGDDIPYVPPGVNRYELIFDTMWANVRYYLRLRTFARMRKSPLTGGGTIHVPKRWNPSLYLDILKFAALVGLRFAKIGPLAFAVKAGRWLGLSGKGG